MSDREQKERKADADSTFDLDLFLPDLPYPRKPLDAWGFAEKFKKCGQTEKANQMFYYALENVEEIPFFTKELFSEFPKRIRYILEKDPQKAKYYYKKWRDRVNKEYISISKNTKKQDIEYTDTVFWEVYNMAHTFAENSFKMGANSEALEFSLAYLNLPYIEYFPFDFPLISLAVLAQYRMNNLMEALSILEKYTKISEKYKKIEAQGLAFKIKVYLLLAEDRSEEALGLINEQINTTERALQEGTWLTLIAQLRLTLFKVLVLLDIERPQEIATIIQNGIKKIAIQSTKGLPASELQFFTEHLQEKFATCQQYASAKEWDSLKAFLAYTFFPEVGVPEDARAHYLSQPKEAKTRHTINLMTTSPSNVLHTPSASASTTEETKKAPTLPSSTEPQTSPSLTLDNTAIEMEMTRILPPSISSPSADDSTTPLPIDTPQTPYPSNSAFVEMEMTAFPVAPANDSKTTKAIQQLQQKIKAAKEDDRALPDLYIALGQELAEKGLTEKEFYEAALDNYHTAMRYLIKYEEYNGAKAARVNLLCGRVCAAMNEDKRKECYFKEALEQDKVVAIAALQGRADDEFQNYPIRLACKKLWSEAHRKKQIPSGIYEQLKNEEKADALKQKVALLLPPLVTSSSSRFLAHSIAPSSVSSTDVAFTPYTR